MSQYVTETEVRIYILDLTYEQNDLQDDLTFSSEEIEAAMIACARAFNGIFPQVLYVQPHCMSTRTNVFLDGTVAYMLRAKVIQLSRNDLDYQAGNVSVNVDGKQIEHFRNLEKKYYDDFYRVAHNMKLTANLNDGFGQIG